MSSIQKLVREAKPARTLWGHVVTYTIDRVTWMRLGEDPPPTPAWPTVDPCRLDGADANAWLSAYSSISIHYNRKEGLLIGRDLCLCLSFGRVVGNEEIPHLIWGHFLPRQGSPKMAYADDMFREGLWVVGCMGTTDPPFPLSGSLRRGRRQWPYCML